MNASSIIMIVLGAFEVLAGLASIFTGKVYMMSGADAYTDESLRKFAMPYGLTNLFVGAGIIMFELIKTPLFKIGDYDVAIGLVALIVLGIAAIAVYFTGKKVLVKKEK